jgi:hypothetical protein
MVRPSDTLLKQVKCTRFAGAARIVVYSGCHVGFGGSQPLEQQIQYFHR